MNTECIKVFLLLELQHCTNRTLSWPWTVARCKSWDQISAKRGSSRRGSAAAPEQPQQHGAAPPRRRHFYKIHITHKQRWQSHVRGGKKKKTQILHVPSAASSSVATKISAQTTACLQAAARTNSWGTKRPTVVPVLTAHSRLITNLWLINTKKKKSKRCERVMDTGDIVPGGKRYVCFSKYTTPSLASREPTTINYMSSNSVHGSLTVRIYVDTHWSF